MKEDHTCLYLYLSIEYLFFIMNHTVQSPLFDEKDKNSIISNSSNIEYNRSTKNSIRSSSNIEYNRAAIDNVSLSL